MRPVQEKLPPHDDEAEEAVIGSLLVDGEAINEIASDLKPDDFFGERNKWIYEACLALYRRSEAITEVSVGAELARENKLENVGGRAYLAHFATHALDPYNIKTHAGIVNRLALMRRLITAGAEIARIGYHAGPDVDEAITRTENIVKQIGESRPATHTVMPEQAFTEASRLLDDIEADRVAAVKTPFPTLNALTGGGMYGGELWYIAGRPGTGKTELCLQFGRLAALQTKQYVLMLSREMAREQLYLRHIAADEHVAACGLRLGDIRSGAYWRAQKDGSPAPPQWKRVVHEAAASFVNLKFAYVSRERGRRLTVADLRTQAMRLQDEHGLCLAIVDYVQLLAFGDGDGDKRLIERVTEVSGQLTDLANELDIPVVAACQLNRASLQREGQIPDLGDLRESGALEQDASGVMIVHRQMDQETRLMQSSGVLRLVKHRQGGGSGQVEVHWQGGQYVETEQGR